MGNQRSRVTIPGFLETMARNASYAWRAMDRNRVFAAVAVLMLTLGIGANTACFTVIRTVLLKPLSYPEPDRLIVVAGGATPRRFEEMKHAARSFTSLGAFPAQEDVTLTGRDQPEVLKAARVSATFAQILGVVPILGRSFLEEEDRPGAVPVAMIGHEFWLTHFQGDVRVVGKTINLSGTPHTIVGVLPARFQFPFPAVDVWLTRPAEWSVMAPKSRLLSPFLTIFGRLRSHVTIQQANAEAQVLLHQYAKNHPAMLDAKPKSPARLKLFEEQVVGNVRTELWMLFGAVGLVLLIACANLASLLLARSRARSREFAVRAALGAGGWKLVEQILTESLLLSLIGGVFGIVLAMVGVKALRHMTAWTLPRIDEVHPDVTVFAFAFLLSCLTGVCIGLGPALAALHSDLMPLLRTAASGTQEHFALRINTRSVLVAGQIALSTILLIGAALLIQSVLHLRSEDLGFNSSNLFTSRISLPPQRYDTDEKRVAFFEDLLERVELQPGVESATAAMTLPMTGYAGSPVQEAEKPLLPLNQRLIATILVVDSHYFRTLKIPVKRGRTFWDRYRKESRRVCVIDEGLARRFWPSYPNGEDPVGHRLFVGGTNPDPAEIIGIVADVHQTLDNSAWPESVYVAISQNALPSAMLAIRAASDAGSVAHSLRQTVRRMDVDQPLSDVQTMQALVEGQLGERWAIMLLLESFAAMAALLAAVGIYGIAAYSVIERTREIGIRRALGAFEGDVLWLITGQSLRLAVIGAALGVGGAWAFTRLMKQLLFHITATDPATMASIPLLFLLVAALASYFPARRAASIDPMAALRDG